MKLWKQIYWCMCLLHPPPPKKKSLLFLLFHCRALEPFFLGYIGCTMNPKNTNTFVIVNEMQWGWLRHPLLPHCMLMVHHFDKIFFISYIAILVKDEISHHPQVSTSSLMGQLPQQSLFPTFNMTKISNTKILIIVDVKL